MSYYDVLSKYQNFDWGKAFSGVAGEDVKRAIYREDAADRLIQLLSPAAEGLLEEMAQRAHEITLRSFGRTIQLYTPTYLSNYCDNQCVYCGFNSNNNITRRRLSIEEVEKEARAIASTGLRHILVLTGESRTMSPVNYIRNSVKILKKYFSSIAIEIYPLTEDEYRELVSEGADALTIYQEVYDEVIYRNMHPAGPKRDYRFRLDAPERGCRAGIRSVNIGVLLGLNDWRREIFLTGLHAKYLQDNFPDVEIGAAIPRVRPQAGNFKAPHEVSDKNIVHMILALRIFLPRIGITLSTRENSEFRENLIPLGITRMSAGSSTKVGGHTRRAEGTEACGQFEICDHRNVEEVKAAVGRRGYQPVMKDWITL